MNYPVNEPRHCRWRTICQKADTWENKGKSINFAFFCDLKNYSSTSQAFPVSLEKTPEETQYNNEMILMMWRASLAKEMLFFIQHGKDKDFIAFNKLGCQECSRCGLVVDFKVNCLVKGVVDSGCKLSFEKFREFFTMSATEYLMLDNLLFYKAKSDEQFANIQIKRELRRDSHYSTYFESIKPKKPKFSSLFCSNSELESDSSNILVTSQSISQTCDKKESRGIRRILVGMKSAVITTPKTPEFITCNDWSFNDNLFMQ